MEKKCPRIETISPESTPEPAPRAKDKKTPDVELFDGNAAKFKEFLSKLETYFRMRPESYPKKDFKREDSVYLHEVNWKCIKLVDGQ